MMKFTIPPWLKPSLENFVGMAFGIGCVVILGMVSHRALGNHRVLNDTVVSLAARYGFDAFTIAMIIGACVALLISFLVTHLIEKLFQDRG